MRTIYKLSDKEQSDIKGLKEMIESCFTYGGADKDSYKVEANVYTDAEGLNYNNLIKQ